MSCKYYTWYCGDFHCMKCKKDVCNDWYYKYCKNYNYDECVIYKESSDYYRDKSGSKVTMDYEKDTPGGGCFLTSACVESRNLPDDCYELQTLRSFRDGWLREQPEGPELIARYYNIAPKIVEKIDESLDRCEIYEAIYNRMVKPCIELIEGGKNREAMELYKTITEELNCMFC